MKLEMKEIDGVPVTGISDGFRTERLYPIYFKNALYRIPEPGACQTNFTIKCYLEVSHIFTLDHQMISDLTLIHIMHVLVTGTKYPFIMYVLLLPLKHCIRKISIMYIHV